MTTVKRRTRKPDSEPTPTRKEHTPAVLAALLVFDRSKKQPFCDCGPPSTFGFDPDIGLYVHIDPACWKPSKAMYAVAAQAGMVADLRKD
jgi:hypothetical protein